MEARKYDVQSESEHLAHITEIVVYLKNYVDEHPCSYPPVMRVYTTLMFGLVPSIKVNCPHDPNCRVKANATCGGLADLFGVLDEAMETIDLELDYECPAYPKLDHHEYDL